MKCIGRAILLLTLGCSLPAAIGTAIGIVVTSWVMGIALTGDLKDKALLSTLALSRAIEEKAAVSANQNLSTVLHEAVEGQKEKEQKLY